MIHTKYRPTNLNEFIGNDAIKRALNRMIESGDFIHTMFCGEKGCGKTTLAYILAKAFGASPANIHDINCVHFAGVDSMRERLEMLSGSVFGYKKVLILDELHELSSKAQQVLLKPLESLKDILIIGCTTTTEKVIDTLLSRFKILRVQKLSDDESLELINRICEKENIKLSKQIKYLLVEKCEGIPRRLLIGIDTVRNVKDISDARVLLDYGVFDDEKDALDILKAVFTYKEWGEIKRVLVNVFKKNSNYESLRVGMMNLLSHRLLSDFSIPDRIDKMYDILKDHSGYPEKANLVMAVYKIFRLKE